MTVAILNGDCRTVLRSLPAQSVQCCVTSPPYFGLRDYGVNGQIGLEQTPDAYVAEMVSVFQEVRRALRKDGTVWLNIGDSYAGSWGAQGKRVVPGEISRNQVTNHPKRGTRKGAIRQAGVKPKDLYMIPARLALALQADGWWVRSAIIWHKPNPMPESTEDRPTSSYEHVFLLTKSARYFYDGEAIREPDSGQDHKRHVVEPIDTSEGHLGAHKGIRTAEGRNGAGRNARNVWTIATSPYSGAHFATMPPDLAERCIKAGSRRGDMVLDPFGGAGTTGLVADRLGRDATLIELNPDYVDLARSRLRGDCPLFASVA